MNSHSKSYRMRTLKTEIERLENFGAIIEVAEVVLRRMIRTTGT